MSAAWTRGMAVATVAAPRLAAVRLVGLDLPRNLLWQALVLAIALNTLMFWLGLALSPPEQPLPAMMATPFMFALTMGCGAVVTVFAVTFVGQWLGGQGRLSDVLALVVWLQFLRLAVQMVASVLMVGAPGVALLVLMAVNVYALWIFVNFIDVAHRFDSLLKSLGVILLAGMGIVMGLILMLAVIGAGVHGGIS